MLRRGDDVLFVAIGGGAQSDQGARVDRAITADLDLGVARPDGPIQLRRIGGGAEGGEVVDLHGAACRVVAESERYPQERLRWRPTAPR